jgi:hypothetical protein
VYLLHVVLTKNKDKYIKSKGISKTVVHLLNKQEVLSSNPSTGLEVWLKHACIASGKP